MPIIVRETGTGDFTPAPEGTHIARCYRLVDIGTQADAGFGERRKIVISWELPMEPMLENGKRVPMSVSRFYTHSLHKQAGLRKDLVRWRGGRDFTKEELAGFTLGKILGTACQVVIVHNEAGKDRVDTVLACPKGTVVPPAHNPLVEYSIEDGKTEAFAALPDWLKKRCETCVEWTNPKPKAPPRGEIPPDINFTDPPPDEGDDGLGPVPF